MTLPALVSCGCCGASSSVYAVASAGRVSCLDPDTGQAYWTLDVAELSHKQAQLLCTPLVVANREGEKERRRLYFGAGLDNGTSSAATLFCIEDWMTPAH